MLFAFPLQWDKHRHVSLCNWSWLGGAGSCLSCLLPAGDCPDLWSREKSRWLLGGWEVPAGWLLLQAWGEGGDINDVS